MLAIRYDNRTVDFTKIFFLSSSSQLWFLDIFLRYRRVALFWRPRPSHPQSAAHPVLCVRAYDLMCSTRHATKTTACTRTPRAYDEIISSRRDYENKKKGGEPGRPDRTLFRGVGRRACDGGVECRVSASVTGDSWWFHVAERAQNWRLTFGEGLRSTTKRPWVLWRSEKKTFSVLNKSISMSAFINNSLKLNMYFNAGVWRKVGDSFRICEH